MKTVYSTSCKTKFIRSLLVVSSIVYLIKSDNNYYIQTYLPPCKEQAENSLNIPRVDNYKFTFNQFETSADRTSDTTKVLNHGNFDPFKIFPLLSYNNYVLVQLESIEHLFLTNPVVKLLHKSIVRQSSEEDPLLS